MNENQIKAVLDQLLKCHRQLDAWDLNNPATTPAEEALKVGLHRRQDEILQNHGQASLELLQLVGKDISSQATQLDALSGQITATADDIAQVISVIAIAAQIVAIAAQIVAMAVA